MNPSCPKGKLTFARPGPGFGVSLCLGAAFGFSCALGRGPSGPLLGIDADIILSCGYPVFCVLCLAWPLWLKLLLVTLSVV